MLSKIGERNQQVWYYIVIFILHQVRKKNLHNYEPYKNSKG